MDSMRTLVTVPPFPFRIDHASRVAFLGSCFATSMSERLAHGGFQTLANPFGVIFHPLPIADILHRSVAGVPYDRSDLFFSEERWFSLKHHGSFQSDSAVELLEQMNRNLTDWMNHLEEANLLVITFGTAWGWEYEGKWGSEVAANCHRLPAHLFRKRMFTHPEISGALGSSLDKVLSRFPGLEIMLTVSPVRYWKDGAHGNQLSKSHLLLAVEELVNEREKVQYFPAYEIVLDDLRDYRFFSEDMLHVSSKASDYVYSIFSEACMSQETRTLAGRIRALGRIVTHRPINPEAHFRQVKKVEDQIREMLRNSGFREEAAAFSLDQDHSQSPMQNGRELSE